MTWGQLHKEVRARLRTLSKENAEVVGGHLVMAGQLLEVDPELAYQHAQAAVRRGGRVDVVREAAGLAAYRTGRHAEALRELRTVRRISGSAEHLAVIADCERGLGRPERAVALASDPDVPTLPLDAAVELAIVVSGARLDLGQPDAAVAALEQAPVRRATGLLAVRVAQARAVALEAAGRADEAAAELAGYTEDDLARAAGNSPVIDDDVVVYDLTEDEDEDEEVAGRDRDQVVWDASDSGIAEGEEAGAEAVGRDEDLVGSDGDVTDLTGPDLAGPGLTESEQDQSEPVDARAADEDVRPAEPVGGVDEPSEDHTGAVITETVAPAETAPDETEREETEPGAAQAEPVEAAE